MKAAATLLIFLLITGCRFYPHSAGELSLSAVGDLVIARNLDGETASALEKLASAALQSSRWKNLPDLAAFVRESPMGKGDELCRNILWECNEACNVQFTPDPASFVKKWRAGELRCRLALALAEKQFLDSVAWKTPLQQQREDELQSELLQLAGDIPESRLSSVKLAFPGEMPEFPAGLLLPVSEDPAEALQIAGVICLLPEEIRRQQLADAGFPIGAILDEITFTAGSYILHLDKKHLHSAIDRYHKEPSAENLWLYRKWFYRTELDISRMPQKKRDRNAADFIASMLLLQESF